MRTVSSGSVRITYPRYEREEVIQTLRARVERLQEVLPVTRVVLFGSYATGGYTAASDIDVLVVYAGAPREDAYAAVKRGFDLRGLEPHVYTDTEAQAMDDTLMRMTRDGVTVFEGE